MSSMNSLMVNVICFVSGTLIAFSQETQQKLNPISSQSLELLSICIIVILAFWLSFFKKN